MRGIVGNEEGDAFFDDDDFPDIPDDELERLEQNAITFTQQERDHSGQRNYTVPPKNLPPSRTQEVHRAIANNTLVINPNHHQNRRGQAVNRTSLQQTSSEGTFLDEDGLPLVVEEQSDTRHQRHVDETAQREQWRVNRFAQPQVQDPVRQRPAALTSRPNPHNALQPQHHDTRASPSFHPPSNSSLHKNVEDEALRARVAELMRERDELTTNLHSARELISARNGEISNIRARQSNEEKTHQRQLAALQKSKQEELDKHAASLQAMNADNAKIASEVQFLKHELTEESRKAQNFQRQLQDRSLIDKPGNIHTTPKRGHTLRDGFDDDEMFIVSPVKSGGRRSKPGTPTANRKRKQPAGTNNNVQPLPLRLSDSNAEAGMKAQANELSSTGDAATANVRKDRATERHLRLVQKVVNFRPAGSQEVLVEQLFRFALPSNESRNFGSIVMDSISKLAGLRLPADLVQVFLDLWSKAMKEEYYICLSLLTSVISFIIDQDPFLIDVAILNSMLPLLQSTIEINATARFKLMKKDYLNSTTTSKPTINSDINNISCMDLVHTIASLISDDSELIGLFWRSISTDFVLMMTNACQPIPEVTLMLQTLASSILPNTFGNICEASQQNRFESHICDRACFLLWQLPKPDADKMPYSQKQICLLRQESLNFLTQLTLGSSHNPFDPSTANNHGTKFLANHPHAISRLVRSVFDELAAAYNMTATQHLHIRLVNTAVRIIHFVLFSPAGRQVDWQGKINGNIGGAHKFRVVMARLAYAEGTEPAIDAGITDDTIRMATELIEDRVTPDEAEDLLKVFEGDGSGSSRKASVMGSTQR